MYFSISVCTSNVHWLMLGGRVNTSLSTLTLGRAEKNLLCPSTIIPAMVVMCLFARWSMHLSNRTQHLLISVSFFYSVGAEWPLLFFHCPVFSTVRPLMDTKLLLSWRPLQNGTESLPYPYFPLEIILLNSWKLFFLCPTSFFLIYFWITLALAG